MPFYFPCVVRNMDGSENMCACQAGRYENLNIPRPNFVPLMSLHIWIPNPNVARPNLLPEKKDMPKKNKIIIPFLLPQRCSIIFFGRLILQGKSNQFTPGTLLIRFVDGRSHVSLRLTPRVYLASATFSVATFKRKVTCTDIISATNCWYTLCCIFLCVCVKEDMSICVVTLILVV